MGPALSGEGAEAGEEGEEEEEEDDDDEPIETVFDAASRGRLSCAPVQHLFRRRH